MTLPRGRFLLLVAVVLLSACGEVISGPTKLSGTLWKLDSLRTPAGVASTVNPDQYNVQFTETLRVAVRADCNVCTGPYTVASIGITIGPLACTRQLCAPGSRGNDYVALLESAKLYSVEGDSLILVSDSGTLLYRP
ncbi:MAG TPA: META domain-containing protein [Vicinamibacteria bacterium]|nr:META domain-containing protein [Vicinamibacteria bacterium]